MARYTPTPLASSYGSVAAINANLTAIQTAIDNCVVRDGTAPNTMSADLDMNSKSILNANSVNAQAILVNGVAMVDAINAATIASTNDAAASAAAALVSEGNAFTSANAASSSAASASNSASAAATSATNSASSAVTAQNAATTALSYTTSGFMGTATLVDLGFVNDATVYFPTDLGVLV